MTDEIKAQIADLEAELEDVRQFADRMENIIFRDSKLLDIERDRSARLIEALKKYASPFTYLDSTLKSVADLQAIAMEALAEYEACRD